MISNILLIILIILIAICYIWRRTNKYKIGKGESLKMFVQSPWMEEIANGRKTVEGRIGPRKKFMHMLNRYIVFHNKTISSQKFITEIRHYDNLDDYLDAEWDKAAPHVSSKKEAKEAYLAIYDRDGRQVFGLLPQGINAIVFE